MRKISGVVKRVNVHTDPSLAQGELMIYLLLEGAQTVFVGVAYNTDQTDRAELLLTKPGDTVALEYEPDASGNIVQEFSNETLKPDL